MGEFLSCCSLRFKTRTPIVHLYCLLLSGRFLRGKIQAPINGWLGSWQRSSCCVSRYRGAPWAEPALCGQLELWGGSRPGPHTNSLPVNRPHDSNTAPPLLQVSHLKHFCVTVLMQNILKESFASKNKEGRGMCRPNTAVTYVFPKMYKIFIFETWYYSQWKHTAIVFLVHNHIKTEMKSWRYQFKGSLIWEFRLHGYYETVSPWPLSILLGPFKFLLKFAEIFTTLFLSTASTTPATYYRQCRRHRWLSLVPDFHWFHNNGD